MGLAFEDARETRSHIYSRDLRTHLPQGGEARSSSTHKQAESWAMLDRVLQARPRWSWLLATYREPVEELEERHHRNSFNSSAAAKDAAITPRQKAAADRCATLLHTALRRSACRIVV